MFDIGRVCVKTSGRDSGQIAVIIDLIDNKFVLVDGNVRRKRCSIRHLEPLPQTLEIEKNSSTEQVKKQLSALGYKVVEKKQKVKKEVSKKESVKEKPKKKKNEK